MRRKLFIDTGHSVKYQGAAGEVAWVRKIAEKLYPLLDTTYWDVVKVPDTYAGENSPSNSLVRRIRWINNNSAASDMLISIHANGAVNVNARGVETCYYSGSEESKAQALRLSHAYSKATGVPLFNDGLMGDKEGRYGRLGMIRDTTPFALLIECGFTSNKEDMSIDPTNAAKGIANYLNSFNTMPDPLQTFEPEQIGALKWHTAKGFSKISDPVILREGISRIDFITSMYRYHIDLKAQLAKQNITID